MSAPIGKSTCLNENEITDAKDSVNTKNAILFAVKTFWTYSCVCLRIVFFFCLVYPILPVSLDCPFLIAPLVISNVSLLYK